MIVSSIFSCPFCGTIRPSKISIIVDLPDPEGPTIPITLCAGIDMLRLVNVDSALAGYVNVIFSSTMSFFKFSKHPSVLFCFNSVFNSFCQELDKSYLIDSNADMFPFILATHAKIC